MRSIFGWIVGIGVLAAAARLDAGTVLVGEYRKLPDGKATELPVFISPTAVRMPMFGAEGGGQGYVIFHPDRQAMWLVRPDRREYSELNGAKVAAMGREISSAMGMVQQQLAKMPAEQRSQVEALMKGLGDSLAGNAAKPVIEKAASGEKIGSWSCDHYVVKTAAGQTLHESWCAPIEDMAIPSAEAGVMRELVAFGDSMSRTMSDAVKGALPGFEVRNGLECLKGVPVRQRAYDLEGQAVAEWELKSMRQESIEAEVFEIPAGFTRQSIPSGGAEPAAEK